MRIVLFTCLLTHFFSTSQELRLSLDEIKLLTLENNHLLAAEEFKTASSKELIRAAFTVQPTEMFYAFDENDLAINGLPNHKFGLQQSFDFPTIYGARKSAYKTNYKLQQASQLYQKARTIKSVSQSYYWVLYLEKKKVLVDELIDLYSDYAQQAKLKYKSGESTKLESITAQTKLRQLSADFYALEHELEEAYLLLRSFVQTDTNFRVNSDEDLRYVSFDSDSLVGAGIGLSEAKIAKEQTELIVKKQEMLPGIHLNYFIGSNRALDANLQGCQIGVSLPLLYFGDRAQIKSKSLAVAAAKEDYENYQWRLSSYKNQLEANLQRYQVRLNYFLEEGLVLSDEIIKIAKMAYEGGEINYFNYTESLENAMRIQLDYLETINNYNQIAIELNYAILEL